jgi:hypothetical protein
MSFFFFVFESLRQVTEGNIWTEEGGLAAGWRILLHDELHNLHSSLHATGDMIKRNLVDGACSMHWKEES